MTIPSKSYAQLVILMITFIEEVLLLGIELIVEEVAVVIVVIGTIAHTQSIVRIMS